MDNRLISPEPSPEPRPCPICDKPGAGRHRPFCSKRCADIDLGRWLKGVYAVPTAEPPGEPAEPGDPSDGDG
jgi:endogenous inhibitor of DNA gyrase (YacG/DUF329 family)